MAIHISVAMQKGGVGKTSTVVNLADALRRLGFRVLVVDLDPQANASRVLGAAPPTSVSPTVTDLILNPSTSVQEAISAAKLPDIGLVYSNIKLATADHRLRNPEQYPQPIQQLQRKLAAVAGFDFVLFDCPPALSLLTMNGLAASDAVIIPMESGSRFSFDGVDDFLDTVRLVKTVNPRLDILGVLITKHDQRHNVCRAVVSSITDRFGEMRFATAITSSTATRKAEFNGLTVIQYDRRCTAAKDYIAFARELLGRLHIEPRKRRLEPTEEVMAVEVAT